MPKIKDGVCILHGLHISTCSECLNTWQESQNKKWKDKQENLNKIVNAPDPQNYYAMTSGLIETE